MNEQENRRSPARPKKPVQRKPEQAQRTQRPAGSRKHAVQKQTPAPERKPRRAAGSEQPGSVRKTAARKAHRPETTVRKPQPETKRHGKLYEVLDAQTEPAPAMPVRNPVLRDAVCGVILAALACVGVWAIVRQCSIRIQQKQSSDPEKAEITACILPLAVMDADSFSDPEEMSDEEFLTASIWSFITDGRLTDYPTETDLCTVPAKEIIAAGNARFGTNRSPKCQTISFTAAVRFYYDPEQKNYLLPADPQYFGYYPEIGSCTEDHGVYTVEAAYHPEQPSWSKAEAQTVRHAVFTLTHTGGAWQICSLDNGAPEKDATETAEPEETARPAEKP